MLASLNRLGPKLLLTTLGFLLILALATAYVVSQGFRKTQHDATNRSKAGLEAQGREYLSSLTEREARISTEQFQQAVAASQYAADYMVSMENLGGSVPAKPLEDLRVTTNGHYANTDADRTTETFVPNLAEHNEQLARDVRDSAALNALFPTLLESYPDAVAIYFINKQGFSRYYPVINLAEIIPRDLVVTDQPFYSIATPENNPNRRTVWTQPYLDPAGQGAMVTASSPVYDGDEFRGVTGIDIQLDRMITHLTALKLNLGRGNNAQQQSNSYAFLVDQQGKLVAAPQIALQDIMGYDPAKPALLEETLGLDLSESPSGAFRTVLDQMKAGKSDVARIELNGKNVFVSFHPLQNIGWSLGMVAPVDEVTAQAEEIAGAIGSGTDATIWDTLLFMSVFFLLALIGTTFFSRRLTRPIAVLVTGTQRVASGDLKVHIPVKSNDELGMLATSFNKMTGELSAARERLESWNATLERTVQDRTAELERAKGDAEHARASAEQANELKTQFLANMSHELRTPLNSIINFTRILSSGIRGPVTEGQTDYLNRVRSSGEHLLGLINDILDLSKIEAGRMDLFKETTQIADLIQSVMSTAAGLTKGKPIQLQQEIEDGIPPIEADRTRLRQVLLNLLSNAAKFTEEGSITVQARMQDDLVLISVQDTGIGIDAEQLPLVFEEFRQIDGSVNRRYEGTGLGLAICRKLIQLHGGDIWVESAPDAGSTFCFSLPLAAADAEDEPVVAVPITVEQSEASTNGNGQLVLVIDDDRAAIEIVSTYLSQDGYQVYGLTDGRRALEEVRRLQPAAIILDVLMPHKDGWEVLAELRADPDIETVPVALYTIVEEKKLGFYLGASAYLTKPIEEQQLRSTIASLVSAGSRVLVIDDDENAREVITQHLQQAGTYSVSTAGDGREGLAKIAASPPDLIILDLMMPEVDGFAVLEQLEQSPQPHAIPVIVLTAKDLSKEEHDFLNRRVNGLLAKGASSSDELLSRMSGLLKPLSKD